MKRILISTAAVLLTLTALGAAAYYIGIKPNFDRLAEMARLPVEDIDLTNLDDGLYSGEFSYSKTHVTVEVAVQDNRIIDIQVATNKENNYTEAAKSVALRVITDQSLHVDTSTGATATSKVVLKAIESALMGGPDN